MRYLGLDLGSKTLGIAISDLTETLATTLTTLNFKDEDYDKLVLMLEPIIKENAIDKIILGFPKNMDNTIGERAEITLAFKQKLENAYNLEVILQDERLTSVISNQVMIMADMSRKKRKKKVDGIAAQLILQSYLDKIKKGWLNMEEKNTFKVMDDNGKEVVCEVLFTFDSEETKKSYIVYTDNTTDEKGNVKVYASVYKPESTTTELLPIETEKEWKIIETILESIQEEQEKNN